jgi:hypothetical protein
LEVPPQKKTLTITFPAEGAVFASSHQLLVYADDVHLVGDSINTIKENTKSLLEVSKDVALKINAEKTKYMITSRHPN